MDYFYETDSDADLELDEEEEEDDDGFLDTGGFTDYDDGFDDYDYEEFEEWLAEPRRYAARGSSRARWGDPEDWMNDDDGMENWGLSSGSMSESPSEGDVDMSLGAIEGDEGEVPTNGKC